MDELNKKKLMEVVLGALSVDVFKTMSENCSRPFMRKIFSGKRKPNDNAIKDLLNELRVDPDFEIGLRDLFNHFFIQFSNDEESVGKLKEPGRTVIIKLMDYYGINHNDGILEEKDKDSDNKLKTLITEESIVEFIKREGLAKEELFGLYIYFLHRYTLYQTKEVENIIKRKDYFGLKKAPAKTNTEEACLKCVKAAKKNNKMKRKIKKISDQFQREREKSEGLVLKENQYKNKIQLHKKEIKVIYEKATSGIIDWSMEAKNPYLKEIYGELLIGKVLRRLRSELDAFNYSNDLSAMCRSLIGKLLKIIPANMKAGMFVICRETNDYLEGDINQNDLDRLREISPQIMQDDYKRMNKKISGWADEYKDGVKKLSEKTQEKFNNSDAFPVPILHYFSAPDGNYRGRIEGYYLFKKNSGDEFTKKFKDFVYELVLETAGIIDRLDLKRLEHIDEHMSLIESVASDPDIPADNIMHVLNTDVVEVFKVMPEGSIQAIVLFTEAKKLLERLIKLKKFPYAYEYFEKNIMVLESIPKSERSKFQLKLMLKGTQFNAFYIRQCGEYAEEIIELFINESTDSSEFREFENAVKQIFYSHKPRPDYELPDYSFQYTYKKNMENAERLLRDEKYEKALMDFEKVKDNGRKEHIPKNDWEVLLDNISKCKARIDRYTHPSEIWGSNEFLNDIKDNNSASMKTVLHKILTSKTYREQKIRGAKNNPIFRYGEGHQSARVIARYDRLKDKVSLYRAFPKHNDDYDKFMDQGDSFRPPACIPIELDEIYDYIH